MKKLIFHIGLLCTLLSAVPSFAEVTLFISPDGDGAFIIEADNINDTPYLEITVIYDPNLLGNPRVSLQGGSVTDMFDSISGTLIFTAFRGDSPASSFEASLAFDKKGESQGGIISVSTSTRESDGTDSPSRSLFNLSPPQSSTTQVSGPGQEHVSSSASAEIRDSRQEGDSSKSSADGAQQTGGEEDGAHPDGKSASGPEKSTATEKTATSDIRPDLHIKTEKSVLQRFRELKGERGLKALVELFAKNPRSMIVQEPPVVLSDGKTPVRIRLELPPKLGNSPNIALTDASLVHVQKVDGNCWLITALPDEGTWNTSLIINVEEESAEYPLVIAPPVKIPKGINEINFVVELDRFISTTIVDGKGESDPLRRIPYEYAFTANYLASMDNNSPKMAPDQPKPRSN
jgi:hypothetical protein